MNGLLQGSLSCARYTSVSVHVQPLVSTMTLTTKYTGLASVCNLHGSGAAVREASVNPITPVGPVSYQVQATWLNVHHEEPHRVPGRVDLLAMSRFSMGWPASHAQAGQGRVLQQDNWSLALDSKLVCALMHTASCQ